MIGIYQSEAGTEDSRIPMSYGGLTFNTPGGKVSTAAAVVLPAWDYVSEPRQMMDGMEVYQPKRMRTVARLDGLIQADSIAELHDLIEEVNAAFDPVMNWLNDDAFNGYVPTQDQGYTPFDFSVPTADEANFPSGLIPMRYFARARNLPVDRTSKFEGTAARWTVDLEAADPRRYLREEEVTLEVANALGTGGTSVLNPLATYPSWPHLVLTAVGGTILTTDLTVTLNDKVLTMAVTGLTLSDGDEVEVNLRQQIITLNGTERMDLLGAGSEWFTIPPGTSTITVAVNNTGGTDFDLSLVWTPARV